MVEIVQLYLQSASGPSCCYFYLGIVYLLWSIAAGFRVCEALGFCSTSVKVELWSVYFKGQCLFFHKAWIKAFLHLWLDEEQGLWTLAVLDVLHSVSCCVVTVTSQRKLFELLKRSRSVSSLADVTLDKTWGNLSFVHPWTIIGRDEAPSGLEHASWCFLWTVTVVPVCVWTVWWLPAGASFRLQIHRNRVPAHLPRCCCAWVEILTWFCYSSVWFLLNPD